MKKIKLTQNKYALVDDEDFELINQFRWNVQKGGNTFYANHGGRKTLGMHRVILRAFKDEIIDHEDGNGLNNQKSNIRIVTCSQNNHNRHKDGFKGIRRHTKNRTWEAFITINGKQIYLGCHRDKKVAAELYNRMAKKHYGKFAKLNIIKTI